jgi:hypothetical protein
LVHYGRFFGFRHGLRPLRPRTWIQRGSDSPIAGKTSKPRDGTAESGSRTPARRDNPERGRRGSVGIPGAIRPDRRAHQRSSRPRSRGSSPN